MADYNFTEREEYEQGFSEVYDQNIVPYLREKELERFSAQKRSKRWVLVVAGIAVLLAWRAFQFEPFLAVFPVATGGGVSLLLYLSRGDKLQSEISAFLRPLLCQFLGVSYAEQDKDGAFPGAVLRELGIIPTSDRSSIGPIIVGNWRDVSYRLTKANFSDRRRDHDGDKKTVQLFGGIVLEIECPVEMPTITFYPDFGGTLNKLYKWATRDGLPPHKLAFPDAEIESVFEVYTDDVKRAKTLLNPSFGNKLLNFSREYQSQKKYISAAFQGHNFYLAIELPHEFMSFDMANKPLDESNDEIHRAMKDLMIPRRIIDILLD